MHDINLDETIFTVPASVLRSSSERQAELLSILRDRHVLDASILNERNPFFWEAEISSSLIDSHYTHMLSNTLSNFRDDAIAGVAALPGHQHRSLPYGRSIHATLEQVENPTRSRVLAAFYTLPGLNLNGIKTDDLIDGLRSGILRDKSVGFFGGQHLCDVCGMDFWDMRCPHVPGLRYEVEKGNSKQMVVATFGVDNARLSEVSNVFDGSTPRAEVLKAEREAQEGRLKPEAIRIIENRYRVTLPATKRAFAGADTRAQTPREAVRMDEKTVEQIRKVLSGPLSEEYVGGLQEEDIPAAIEAVIKTMKSMEPQAADGRAYRTDLIATALAEGVRAYGNDFDKATYEATLTNAPLATIKRMAADWQKVADVVLPAGRHTVDDDQTPTPERKTVSRVPDAAYAA